MGFAEEYDFFIYFPAKRRAAENQENCMAYAFVNFRSQGEARSLSKLLNGKVYHGSPKAINVVKARVQGFAACCQHFNRMDDSKIVPWMDNTCVTEDDPRRYQ